MGIADNPSWVQALDDGIAAMRQAHADRGWYDSHDLINWLNEHSNTVLNEIIDSYRFRRDGTPAHDPILTATRQIAKFLQHHRHQVQLRKHISQRNAIQTVPPRAKGNAVVAVWQISSVAATGNVDGLPNGSSVSNEPDEPRVPTGMIHDRGRGPEIRGTRITVYNLLPHLLDPTATEDFICQVNRLTPEQVAAARAYILNNPDTVLSQHLRIEERMAAGNSPQVREKARESRATFLRFKEWLSNREKEVHQTPQATAIEDGGGNRSGSFPTFREWLAEQKSRPEERS